MAPTNIGQHVASTCQVGMQAQNGRFVRVDPATQARSTAPANRSRSASTPSRHTNSQEQPDSLGPRLGVRAGDVSVETAHSGLGSRLDPDYLPRRVARSTFESLHRWPRSGGLLTGN